tara:strand:- start:2986 stop:3309 length:324 start_codon:yes stop_codon:yes gene_type:complete
VDEKLGNDLRELLLCISKITDEREYQFHVNTVAQLLMGHKFGYMEHNDDDIVDIQRLKHEAKVIQTHGTCDHLNFIDSVLKEGVTLKPNGKRKLVVIDGGKDDIDQK